MVTNMTLQQKIGQKIIAGFPGTELDEDFKNLIRQYKIGNVILFSHNMESVEQIQALCNSIQELVQQETGLPAFITIDQEGGVVSRIPDDFIHFPSAMAVAATKDSRCAYEIGHMTAKALKYLGINFNLAPVFDVNSNSNNPVIGVRSYADNPQTVARFAIAMAKGLTDGGVLSCGKHFPGHGDTDVDSHIGLPIVNKTLAELLEIELYPFIEGVKAGLPAIMTSHIRFPKIEPNEIPATMSHKIITDILKKQMGFQGLVLSDCLEMNAIQKFYGTKEGAVKALEAGVDILCISHTRELVVDVVCEIEKEIQDGILKESDIDESVNKIVALKSKITLNQTENTLAGWEEDQEKLSEIFCKGITYVNSTKGSFTLGTKPLFIGCNAYRSTLVSSAPHSFNFAEYMGNIFHAKAIKYSDTPEEEEIESIRKEAEGSSSVVIGTYNGHLRKEQIRLVNELCKVHNQVIAVALRNPYDLSLISEKAYKIATYDYSYATFQALSVCLKNGNMEGKLPITMDWNDNI